MWWGKITPTLKDVHILISKPVSYYLTRWEKLCLCRCDYVKGLEIRRVIWIVQVGAVQSQTSLEEWSRMSEQESDSKMLSWWFEDSGMGSWATKGSWLLESRKSKEADFFLEPPEGILLCWSFDFCPVRPFRTSDLQNH